MSFVDTLKHYSRVALQELIHDLVFVGVVVHCRRYLLYLETSQDKVLEDCFVGILQTNITTTFEFMQKIVLIHLAHFDTVYTSLVKILL